MIKMLNNLKICYLEAYTSFLLFGINLTNLLNSSDVGRRRVSTRSIKRKKFDDELVESSLAKTDRTGRAKGGTEPKTPTTTSTSHTTSNVTTSSSEGASVKAESPAASTVTPTAPAVTTTNQSTEKKKVCFYL